jgi:hypothetical protein
LLKPPSHSTGEAQGIGLQGQFLRDTNSGSVWSRKNKGGDMAINFFCKCKKLQDELDEKEKNNHALFLQTVKLADEIENIKKEIGRLKERVNDLEQGMLR